jgi:hypothetical protein
MTQRRPHATDVDARATPLAHGIAKGPSLRWPLILKPCKFAVQPVCDRRATSVPRCPGTCIREAGLDSALVKDSVGTYRKDGQD